jgi:hypothetical protein
LKKRYDHLKVQCVEKVLDKVVRAADAHLSACFFQEPVHVDQDAHAGAVEKGEVRQIEQNFTMPGKREQELLFEKTV